MNVSDLAGRGSRKELEAVDQLLYDIRRYETTSEFKDLLRIVRRFPAFAPYNCFLIHVQRPGASYVARAPRWEQEFGRQVKPRAIPIVILVPFGPVNFVYDVEDTQGEPLPEYVVKPFQVRGRLDRRVWERLCDSCARERIKIEEREGGSALAGDVMPAGDNVYVQTKVYNREKRTWETKELRALWSVSLNRRESNLATRFSTLVHELAHIYCGHLWEPGRKRWGTKWISERGSLNPKTMEFEAETVAYMVCTRFGIVPPSARYLFGYLDEHQRIPSISLDTVLKVAGTIERNARNLAPIRNLPKSKETS